MTGYERGIARTIQTQNELYIEILALKQEIKALIEVISELKSRIGKLETKVGYLGRFQGW